MKRASSSAWRTSMENPRRCRSRLANPWPVLCRLNHVPWTPLEPCRRLRLSLGLSGLRTAGAVRQTSAMQTFRADSKSARARRATVVRGFRGRANTSGRRWGRSTARRTLRTRRWRKTCGKTRTSAAREPPPRNSKRNFRLRSRTKISRSDSTSHRPSRSTHPRRTNPEKITVNANHPSEMMQLGAERGKRWSQEARLGGVVACRIFFVFDTQCHSSRLERSRRRSRVPPSSPSLVRPFTPDPSRPRHSCAHAWFRHFVDSVLRGFARTPCPPPCAPTWRTI